MKQLHTDSILQDEPRSTWQDGPTRFYVRDGGSRMKMAISVDGLEFVARNAHGQEVEILLDWHGTMEFVEWVHTRLPLPDA